jgi:hypothetical protein
MKFEGLCCLENLLRFLSLYNIILSSLRSGIEAHFLYSISHPMGIGNIGGYTEIGIKRRRQVAGMATYRKE